MRVRQGLRVLVGALLLQVLGGCAAGAAGPPSPRELVAGVDVCEYCHMMVDEPGRAAQWLEPGGKALLFDEPGCLVAWLLARPEAAGEAFFGDAGGTGWIPAAEASFIREGPGTGMGFDIVAYRSAEAARHVAAEMGGRVVAWRQLLSEGVAHGHEH